MPTDAKGNYSLAVSEVNSVVDFTYIGYETQELQASEILAGSAIILKPAPQNLREVVINKGYYSQKQLENTGDVSVVKGADVEKQPVTDPILALDGRVPGIYISQTIGAPGSNSIVRIRGQNSIFNGNTRCMWWMVSLIVPPRQVPPPYPEPF